MNPAINIKKRFLQVMRLAIAERWKDIDSKKDFAEMIGITNPQSITAIENQKGRYPTLQMIYNMCDIFGVQANFIISGTGPMKVSDDPYEEQIRKIKKIIS